MPEPDGSRPIGNGAVVTWTTGSEDYETSYAMVMIGNVITYAPDAGRTSAVTLSALDYLWVSGNTIEMGLNHRALVLGQGNAAHQVPAAFVVKNNDLVQGDFMLHSLVADYCVSSNDIAGGAFFLGGAPISQPICEGAFCASCPVPCPADIGGDGTVGITDLLTLLGAWGPNPGHPADIDDNGFVGQTDLLMMLAAWGKCT